MAGLRMKQAFETNGRAARIVLNAKEKLRLLGDRRRSCGITRSQQPNIRVAVTRLPQSLVSEFSPRARRCYNA